MGLLTPRTVQSTLGAQLAAILGVPFISLDRLFWLPNWAKTPDEEFKHKVRAALDQSDGGWVVDGNYTRVLGSLLQGEATDIVCKYLLDAVTQKLPSGTSLHSYLC